MQSGTGVYIVGDFMTRKEELHVVKPTTSVDEGSWNLWIFSSNLLAKCGLLCLFIHTALEILVEKRITGFPVIDDNWKLVSFHFPYLLETFLYCSYVLFCWPLWSISGYLTSTYCPTKCFSEVVEFCSGFCIKLFTWIIKFSLFHYDLYYHERIQFFVCFSSELNWESICVHPTICFECLIELATDGTHVAYCSIQVNPFPFFSVPVQD